MQPIRSWTENTEDDSAVTVGAEPLIQNLTGTGGSFIFLVFSPARDSEDEQSTTMQQWSKPWLSKNCVAKRAGIHGKLKVGRTAPENEEPGKAFPELVSSSPDSIKLMPRPPAPASSKGTDRPPCPGPAVPKSHVPQLEGFSILLEDQIRNGCSGPQSRLSESARAGSVAGISNPCRQLSISQ